MPFNSLQYIFNVIGWLTVCSIYISIFPTLHWNVSPIIGLNGFNWITDICKQDIKYVVIHFILSILSVHKAAFVKKFGANLCSYAYAICKVLLSNINTGIDIFKIDFPSKTFLLNLATKYFTASYPIFFASSLIYNKPDFSVESE